MRSQFEDWKSTFQPIELQALQGVSLNNPEVLPDALANAQSAVEQSYSTLSGTLTRENESLGILPNAQQTKTTKRLFDLAKNASMAGAKNQTRANVRQLDEQAILGAAPNANIAANVI